MYSHLKSKLPNKEFDIVYPISIACRQISEKVKRASIEKLYGGLNLTNFNGDNVKKLDILSNDLFVDALNKVESINRLISEEVSNPIEVDQMGEYTVAFDPLDGSSNIDANINIGSIFGIYQTNEPMPSGKDLVISGYCLYGPATLFVLAYNDRVECYTLDEHIGEFVLTNPDVTVPEEYSVYSINESYDRYWDEHVKRIVQQYKDEGRTLRFVGSMVADVHRTIMYGGVFLYPVSKKHPMGRLRYLYEIAPMSHIVKSGGGKAVLEGSVDALSHKPNCYHEKVGIYLGSSKMISGIEEEFDRIKS